MRLESVVLAHDGRPGSPERIPAVLGPAAEQCPELALKGVLALGGGDAAGLAEQLGTRVLDPGQLGDTDLVVGTLHPETLLGTPELGRAGMVAADRLIGTDREQVERLRGLAYADRLRPLTPWRHHAAVTPLLASVAGGRFGLIHAIHAELLAGNADVTEGTWALPWLTAGVLDLISQFVPAGELTLHAVECGSSVTLSGTWRDGCIFTAMVGSPRPGVPESVHRYRLLASHGQAFVDLASPLMTLYTNRIERIPLTTTPMARQLSLIATGGGAGFDVLVDSAARVAMIRESIATGAVVSSMSVGSV
ncbi:hypothetical protein CGZ94_03940 [Enemella evansiae]|uniref:Uncharacterized protein n=1 Tax=Enemella evansiae TaxID=2016499 RepID=A0A255GLS3_9ACTN|nr:hypothetical protein [Enemella evansiae]OYO02120.1 hypothetical protein CGZ95_06255 [Enemella evansiae]OYO16788.1 hypothetical protein CGZ94_03940 [Enemella evansiae]